MPIWSALMLLLCWLPGILVAVLVTKEVRHRRRLATWPHAEAEITGTWRTSSSSRPHAVAYVFDAQGTEQHGQATGLHAEPAGPTLKVVYDPDDPAESFPALKESTGTLVFSSVALVAFSIFLTYQLARGLSGG